MCVRPSVQVCWADQLPRVDVHGAIHTLCRARLLHRQAAGRQQGADCRQMSCPGHGPAAGSLRDVGPLHHGPQHDVSRPPTGWLRSGAADQRQGYQEGQHARPHGWLRVQRR